MPFKEKEKLKVKYSQGLKVMKHCSVVARELNKNLRDMGPNHHLALKFLG